MKEQSAAPGVWVVLALLGLALLPLVCDHATESKPITYSRFEQLLREGKVRTVEISSDEVIGELKQAEEGMLRFTATRVDPDLSKQLEAHGVEYYSNKKSVWGEFLRAWVLPLGVLWLLWALIIRGVVGQGGAGRSILPIGKSRAKVYVESRSKVMFRDVAGIDEAKEELEEIVSFLRDVTTYGRLGARAPKGVLLVGPPGTGKTLLARAVAGEANVPFFSISGSEFVELFVGVGAARVRDLFEQARQKAPCIIFIDELDALGRARGSYPGFSGHDEKEQTLNQLLAELDGFDPTSGIVLLGATNRPEMLDPALLRAGRFDRQVLVDRPDKRGRIEILKVHIVKIVVSPEVDVDEVASLTPGFTGADLANLVNEAALVATRRNAVEVGTADFQAAIERIVAGLERRNRLINPRERVFVAYHEMGHALVAASLPGSDPVRKVSIIPRGIGALGYTIQRPTADRYLMTQSELEDKMSVLLGGRAAEKLVFGHLSTGAADDLAKAADIARSMATRYAMAPELGNVSHDSEQPAFLGSADPDFRRRLYSEETAREIDSAVKVFVEKAFQRASGILEANRDVLEEGAAQLLAKETLTETELEPVFSKLIAARSEERTPDLERMR